MSGRVGRGAGRRAGGAGLLLLLLVLVAALLPGHDVRAEVAPEIRGFFPQATRVGEREGDPPAQPVYAGDELLGYVFETVDIAPIPAYSGKPVNLLVGLDREGVIRGALVLEHHEPILLVGIPEQRLFDFAAQYRGKKVTDRIAVGSKAPPGFDRVDAVTGATVTVMVVNQTIMRAARKVAASRGIAEVGVATAARAKVRMDVFEPRGWSDLLGAGAVRRLHLTRGEVDDAFRGTAGEGVGDAPPEARDETFIDLYYAYLNPPTVGRNLLGEEQYRWLMETLEEGEHAIAVMANGLYSFKGSGYVRGGIFDRVQLRQDGQLITFHDLDYYRLADVYADGIPTFREMAIFVIRKGFEFDPGTPWELELLVRRQVGPVKSVFTSFTAGYETPEAFLERPQPAAEEAGEGEPMWVSVWRNRRFDVAVLLAGLGALVLILVFQEPLARRPRLLRNVRHLYLVYTLFFIGWYGLAQLSVVNVFTFINAVIHEFRWELFLMDPMIFILWIFVAATLLLLGRGIYCGWLCPFGALQELINEIAVRLGVRQIRIPFAVHERLWALKYVILLVLFGISLESMATAERYAEVEPFKTAIMLRFQREWPFVLYAAGLLVASVFNRKFYCRYLCPLGAALVVPGRLHLFEWLKRRRECGSPCRLCGNECEVQAIHPDGRINLNECHYCLDCQVTYFDDRRCPPLVARRRRAKRGAGKGSPQGEEAAVRTADVG
ncbi:transcriptional regulator NosR [Inmirania thermothiophila]|uniref:NosR/NirI family nitrous oxide reductase transcriptional regulator n=1 Tax=Inmirania thermothiophila TaxID=1750597 RepID=A0A3N1Y448_9GAMM|nr:NosR/NirI family protein [Inmirania thermothiophila]ROR32392.1 NosR/NirI family nitrous oxide reductase transcriptional regulator [Inmirania thermothiophila]